jgi:Rrf2 family protein
MHISTRGRYGLRALIELALRYGDGPVQLASIARRQGISRKYLEQLMVRLRKAGLVRSFRGVQGGYALARSPSDIRIHEVVEALEGNFAPVACLDEPEKCDRSARCASRDFWKDLYDAMEKVLRSRTLQDLAELSREKER